MEANVSSNFTGYHDGDVNRTALLPLSQGKMGTFIGCLYLQMLRCCATIQGNVNLPDNVNSRKGLESRITVRFSEYQSDLSGTINNTINGTRALLLTVAPVKVIQ